MKESQGEYIKGILLCILGVQMVSVILPVGIVFLVVGAITFLIASVKDFQGR